MLVNGRNYRHLFLGLLLLILSCRAERQRYDGWFNNLANPSWGSVGEEIVFKAAPAYSDLTYKPAGSDRPNPRVISNAIFKGPSGLPSYANRTALFAFFGQLVAYEIVHAADGACPVELLKVPVPAGDPDFPANSSGIRHLPFVRSAYNKHTGQSPNNPRRPVNKATSWIDGNFIYGRGEVWANCLREFSEGRLVTQNHTKNFPGVNKVGLPMENYPSPRSGHLHEFRNLWMFGDPHTHQHPALMSLALVWFRYHNYMATMKRKQHRDWSDERVYHAARKHVIAVLQNIVVYEWLPALLNTSLPTYTGYKSHVQPAVSALFEAAAFRAGHSQVPPGIYLRDEKCNYKSVNQKMALRLCNSYWDSQDVLNKHGVEKVLMGLASQIAEREDHIIVNDLRGKNFGPLHFSRHDLATLTIMRGRDHGLPDYNTAREAYGLDPVRRWKEINMWLDGHDSKPISELRKVYNYSLDNLDVYPAGLLEATPSGPGPLFTAVLVDQFTRIRDGDRYWFENKQNGVFSDQEIRQILNTKFKDILIAATDIRSNEIQDEVFFWKKGDPCPQPKQLEEDDMEPCTPHKGFDYFTGSEASYIIAFVCFGVLPFACIGIAFIIATCKKIRLRDRETSSGDLKTSGKPSTHFSAKEWVGPRALARSVEVRLDHSKCAVTVISSRRSVLRVLDLRRQSTVAVWLSTDRHSDMMLIHVPREYDLVLKFESQFARSGFYSALRELLHANDKSLLQHQSATQALCARAVTKEKRQQLITDFFRCAFAKAYDIQGIPNPEQMDLSDCKEIVECELTRAEFAEALALLPDSLFVNQMFSLIDRDRNGFICFKELLYAVLLFSKGSCEDKLQLLFNMYDTDGSGTLSRQEVNRMLRSMLEIANTNLDHDEVDKLVSQMFVKAGLERRTSLRFKEFTSVLAEHMDMLWDVCLDWKGTKVCLPKRKKDRGQSSKSGEGYSAHNKLARTDMTEDGPRTMTRCALFMKDAKHYIENHRQQIVWLIIFFSICVAVFSERFYFYAVEQEHVGLRSIAGYGISLTRGAAAGMSFTYSLMLLTVCRNIITQLRETVLNYYIPFDANIAFHKIVAYTALVFTLMHVIGYSFNFYHVATQPVPYLCVFDEVYFRSGVLPKFTFWLFGNLIGMTGVLLIVVLCVMYIFATSIVRTHIFNAFWITHKLFYLLYILTLLHGSVRLVQQPAFYLYFLGPAALFLIDKTVSLSRKKRELSVIRAELLPSDVTLLEFKRPANFEYRSGQWLRLACADLGRDEYHALTLTSAPHEDTLSVHVRGVGPWTWNLRHVFNPDCLKDKPFPKVYIDGPFGAGQQDWFRYEVSVLVGGGIGVTPYASILKDFAFMSSVKNTFKLKCQKVYFIWVTGSQKHFEWFVDILRQVEDADTTGRVHTDIFITQLFQQFDLRSTMLYICEEHFQTMAGRSMFTGLKARTHFGRPCFVKVLQAVSNKHTKVRKVGVFSCGPPGLTKGVQNACHELSKQSKTRFEHHQENF